MPPGTSLLLRLITILNVVRNKNYVGIQQSLLASLARAPSTATPMMDDIQKFGQYSPGVPGTLYTEPITRPGGAGPGYVPHAIPRTGGPSLIASPLAGRRHSWKDECGLASIKSSRTAFRRPQTCVSWLKVRFRIRRNPASLGGVRLWRRVLAALLKMAWSGWSDVLDVSLRSHENADDTWPLRKTCCRPLRWLGVRVVRAAFLTSRMPDKYTSDAGPSFADRR